jgi:hypothetical protein
MKVVEDKEWSGLPKINYCCINSFTTRYNKSNDTFENFVVQELKSNAVIE